MTSHYSLRLSMTWICLITVFLPVTKSYRFLASFSPMSSNSQGPFSKRSDFFPIETESAKTRPIRKRRTYNREYWEKVKYEILNGTGHSSVQVSFKNISQSIIFVDSRKVWRGKSQIGGRRGRPTILISKSIFIGDKWWWVGVAAFIWARRWISSPF